MEKTKRARGAPEKLGFGVEAMKATRVCGHCGAVAGLDKYLCPECGGRLPRENLFEEYQKRHRLCPVCETVLAGYMRYCPHCGAKADEAEEDAG